MMLFAAFIVLGFTPASVPQVIIPCMVFIGVAFSLVTGAIWPCLFFVVDSKMFGTAYGLMSAFLNTGNMIVYWLSGKLIEDVFWANMLWAGLAAVGFVISVIWNIVDARNGGLANLPSKQTVDLAADEDEEAEDEEPEGKFILFYLPVYTEN